MYKLVACDLDETLLSTDKTVSKKNKEAIKKAREEYGIKFAIATGRSIQGANNVLKELDLLEKENEYSITVNGAIVVENKGNRLLSQTTLDAKTVEKIVRFAYAYDLCIQIFTTNDIKVLKPNKKEMDLLEHLNIIYEICELEDVIAKLDTLTITKVLFEKEDMDYLYAVDKEMDPALKDQLAISFSSGRYMECNVKGIHKGKGILALGEILGIDPSEIIAIGDNDNDIEMIKCAGLGVAVANASASVLKVADAVTKADHNHDAIAEVLETYIFKS